MESQQVVGTIQAILASSSDDIEYVTSRLRDEFARLYPLRDPASASSIHLNPLTILTKLRSLQAALPTIRDQLLDIHEQKAALVMSCSHDLLELRRLTATLGGGHVAADALDKQLQAFRVADMELKGMGPAANFAERDLNLAMLRAATVTAPDSARVLQPASENGRAMGGEGVCPDSAKQKEGTDEKAKDKVSNATEDKAKSDSTGRVFVPVEKSAFNRLPRTLKIHAGKLPEINAFYEKVWSVLVNENMPMSDKKLMDAVGESDTRRIEVLRGLSVVRGGAGGWHLPEVKVRAPRAKIKAGKR